MAGAMHDRQSLLLWLCCSDIVKNKIAADEVGDDLRKVANTLSDAATQTERTVEKKVTGTGLPLHMWECHVVLETTSTHVGMSCCA